MLVLFQICPEAYDEVKWGIPLSILVDLPVPDGSATPDSLTKLCIDFLCESTDPDIVRGNELLAKKFPDYHGDCPYNFTILTYETSLTIDHPDRPTIIDISIAPTPADVKARLVANDVLPAAAAMAIQTGTCTCCQLSENIYEALSEFQGKTAINCPWCGKAIDALALEPTAVQAANYYSVSHRVGMYPVTACPHCGEHIAMIPTRISYNGNHGVYYTGGADYIADGLNTESISKEIESIFDKHVYPSIKQYVERKLHPADVMDKMLSDWNLHLWTSRDFEAAIVEYFYNHGLKE